MRGHFIAVGGALDGRLIEVDGLPHDVDMEVEMRQAVEVSVLACPMLPFRQTTTVTLRQLYTHYVPVRVMIPWPFPHITGPDALYLVNVPGEYGQIAEVVDYEGLILWRPVNTSGWAPVPEGWIWRYIAHRGQEVDEAVDSQPTGDKRTAA